MTTARIHPPARILFARGNQIPQHRAVVSWVVRPYGLHNRVVIAGHELYSNATYTPVHELFKYYGRVSYLINHATGIKTSKKEDV
jgi:hypothetical protein